MTKKLSWIQITSLYIGVIMGAGFASGRECWQFFGVFGISKVIGGIIIAILCIITVLGDFERVSKVFSLMVPALLSDSRSASQASKGWWNSSIRPRAILV